ncbi:Olfactory receptor 2G2 [Heterocephalus glaber]|uniref:Olfactory receptor 2G2 n=1 Tax=Heterocephalus glaber TaxID=10181 RepID=G5C443_HETGA|nr:Olfactory receptor 2G2 [Heterocephalus glaber]
MVRTKETSGTGFILLGFSSHLKLRKVLFVVVLILYLLTILGSTAIILASGLDPKFHMPMYYFLSHLSFLDPSFTSSVIPQLLVNLGDSMKSIPYGGCVVRLYLSFTLQSTECVLLAVMSYDFHVAVCHPLHYVSVTHPQLCHILASVAWLSSMATTLAGLMDTTFNEAELFEARILLLLMPISLILGSYGHITQAVLGIMLAMGRKAIGTCFSHLLVVVIFYGTIILMYLQPARSYSKD